MAVIWTLILTASMSLLATIGIIVSRQMTDEFKAWLPWLTSQIVRKAVSQLSQDERDRYAEEWFAHLDQVPGDIGKLVVAIGFLKASREMRPYAAPLLYLVSKRAFDIFLSAAGLLTFTPLFMAIALAIKLTSDGPLLFADERVDLRGRSIRLYRFRTTIQNEIQGDLTNLGKVLRKTSLDYLPELFNVLKGDLSLVGPRPLTEELDKLRREHHLSSQLETVELKPGLTGWAQVANYPDEDHVGKRLIARIEHDLYYAENRSMLLDLKIMLKTIWKEFTHCGRRIDH